MAHNLAFVVDVSGVFANHWQCVVNLVVGVIVAALGVEAMLALGSLGEVVGFVAIVHLLRVEFAHAGDYVGAINAFNGALLIFVGVFPRNRAAPVEAWCDGVAFAVFFNLEGFVSAVSRVGKAFADD